MRRYGKILFLWGSILTLGQLASAQAPVEFVPDRAPLVFAVDDPAALLQTAQSLPFDRLQDQLPALRLAMMAPQMLAFRGGLMWAEGQLGAGYQEVLKVAAGGGLVVAIENEKSIVIVTRSSQPERLPGLLRVIAQLASGKKVGRDAPAPKPEATYRDIDAYKVGELAAAVVGESVVLASNGELAKAAIDKLLDGGDLTLWNDLPAGKPTSVRMLLRHEAIPNAAEQIAKATGPNRDFGQELLLGGLLSALTADGVSSLVLDVEQENVTARWDMLRASRSKRSTLATSRDNDSAAGESNEEDDVDLASIRQQIVMHPLQGSGASFDESYSSLSLPEPQPGTIAHVTLYRDLAFLWSEKDTLLSEDAAARLEVADSQLSTAFGGFDFGDEVLAAVDPALRLLVYPVANLEAKPPTLPEMAIVGSLRADNPQQVARRFRIAWQTIIGIINVERGGNGLPQLELETRQEDGLRMMTGRYSVADAEELNADSVDLYASLAPTMATSGRRIVISTSDQLAEKVIADEALQPQVGDGGVISVHLDGNGIASILKQNRPALLAQNMLEKGSSKEQAESEIDTLIGAVAFFKSASLRVVVHPRGLAASARLDWSEKR